MRIIISLLLSVCCIGLVLAETKAEPEKTIRVRTESWQYFTQEDGSGYNFDVIRAIYEPLGYSLDIQFCNWRACILKLMQGEADLAIGLSDSDIEATPRLQRPDYPTHFERVAVAYKTARFPNWQGEQDFLNKKVVQHKGFGHEKHLSVPVSMSESVNGEQAWHLLESNQADFFIEGLAVLQRQVKTYDPEAKIYSIKQIKKVPNYFGFGVDLKSRHLIKAFNERYPKLYQDGVIQDLQKKWQLRWPIPLEKHAIKSK